MVSRILSPAIKRGRLCKSYVISYKYVYTASLCIMIRKTAHTLDGAHPAAGQKFLSSTQFYIRIYELYMCTKVCILVSLYVYTKYNFIRSIYHTYNIHTHEIFACLHTQIRKNVTMLIATLHTRDWVVKYCCCI